MDRQITLHNKPYRNRYRFWKHAARQAVDSVPRRWHLNLFSILFFNVSSVLIIWKIITSIMLALYSRRNYPKEPLGAFASFASRRLVGNRSLVGLVQSQRKWGETANTRDTPNNNKIFSVYTKPNLNIKEVDESRYLYHFLFYYYDIYSVKKKNIHRMTSYLNLKLFNFFLLFSNSLFFVMYILNAWNKKII